MNELKKVNILNIYELLEFLKKFSYIMSFCPLYDEPDIGFLNQWILDQGKYLICPKIKGTSLLPCKISNLSQLRRGKWWILEASDCNVVDFDQIEVVLIPGKKFDIYGHRQGRGKWYYDRFLVKLPNAVKIGVLNYSQLVTKLNSNPWDVKMDILLQL